MEFGNWFYYVNDIKHLGWLQLGAFWYYLNPANAGAMFSNGLFMIHSEWHHFASNGVWLGYGPVVKNGWKFENEKWYYYVDDLKHIGWLDNFATWYYLDPANGGAMLAGGIFTIEGELHVFGDSGNWIGYSANVKNGWFPEAGDWYFYVNNEKQYLWFAHGGHWYYLDPNRNGAMVSGGRFYVDGGWHWFSSSGIWLGPDTF